MGGWGLKDLNFFSKESVGKRIWRILKGEGLWPMVVINKYISPLSVEEWFRSRDKNYMNMSIMWKAILHAFDLIGDGMERCIRNGTNLRIR